MKEEWAKPPGDDRYQFYQCYTTPGNYFMYDKLEHGKEYTVKYNSRLLFVNRKVPEFFHKAKIYWDFLPRY